MERAIAHAGLLMLDILLQPQSLISLATLTAMETVLGIDNIVFLSILTDKLPPERRPFARRVGLGVALGSRLALLFAISWVMGLTAPVFSAASKVFTGRDLILLAGGLFLLGKATLEMHNKLEVAGGGGPKPGSASMGMVLLQILVLDIVFSLDSVITAVGMAQHISIMVIAMLISMAVMLIFAAPIGDFVQRHPTMKILALSFLLLIGVMLVAEGMGQHIPKGYIYFAMAFALGIELVNMRVRAKQAAPLALHDPREAPPRDGAASSAASPPAPAPAPAPN
ncbi:MAG TPA: TerC family protein [Candidatus Nanopelagicales bacterium]|nr:TerC family protein [Candidatus Nanopelagicales bacterium]